MKAIDYVWISIIVCAMFMFGIYLLTVSIDFMIVTVALVFVSGMLFGILIFKAMEDDEKNGEKRS